MALQMGQGHRQKRCGFCSIQPVTPWDAALQIPIYFLIHFNLLPLSTASIVEGRLRITLRGSW